MDRIITQYRCLLETADSWFASCLSQFPDEIACGRGCSACCRGLFDINILDAIVLRRGLESLPENIRHEVSARSEKVLSRAMKSVPCFAAPYILNHHSEDEWLKIMPEEDETPCVLLGSDGLCLVYECRPLTCRLHGLPHVDISGEVMSDNEWCPLNFQGHDPMNVAGIRMNFRDLFRQEAALLGKANDLLTGIPTAQFDTLIPAAVAVDFSCSSRDAGGVHGISHL